MNLPAFVFLSPLFRVRKILVSEVQEHTRYHNHESWLPVYNFPTIHGVSVNWVLNFLPLFIFFFLTERNLEQLLVFFEFYSNWHLNLSFLNFSLMFPNIKILENNIGDVTNDQEKSRQLECIELIDTNLWKEIMSFSTWALRKWH